MRVPGPDDGEAQLRRAQQGNRDAVQDLFAWHVPRLHRWARSKSSRWPSGASDYEDLVQITVLKTLRRLHLLDPARPNEVQAYMRRVLLNLVRDAARQAQREPSTVPIQETHGRSDRSPADALSERQARKGYRAAWAQLSQKDRDCIRHRQQQGLPYDVIATRLQMPTANAARVAYGRALTRLCRLMNLSDCEAMHGPARAATRGKRRRSRSAPGVFI